jgi:hypothetical protein
MRIRIGSFWLAGNPNVGERVHSSALMQYAPQRLQQAVAGLRWTEMQFFDRGNASWEITFETTRRFATFTEVDDFIQTYPSKHPFQGTVSFRKDLPSGEWEERNLQLAVIEPPVMIPQGVSLHLRYTLRGARFVAGITSLTIGFFDLTKEGGGALATEEGDKLQIEH